MLLKISKTTPRLSCVEDTGESGLPCGEYNGESQLLSDKYTRVSISWCIGQVYKKTIR
jgi:hypothetical protein